MILPPRQHLTGADSSNHPNAPTPGSPTSNAVDAFTSQFRRRYPARPCRLPGGFPARRVLVNPGHLIF